MTAAASPPPWPRRSSGPSPVGTKRGIDEVLACFAALDSVGFKAETFFLQAGDDYVVDIHRGYSTGRDGKVDTTWALVWHLDAAGKVDRVVNLSGDQHQVDAFFWANFPAQAATGAACRLKMAGEGDAWMTPCW
jgi:hypothetical protein